MIYPPNLLEKLGFEDIKLHLKKHCLSVMGSDRIDRLKISTDFETIQCWLKQTDEFKQILLSEEKLPIGKFFDLEVLIQKIRIEGYFLQEEEFFKLKESLQTIVPILKYFKDRQGVYPYLELLVREMRLDKQLLVSIDIVIDDKGKVRGSASKLLQELNREIQKMESETRRKIDQIFANAQANGWTSDGSLTVREGRLCIPILAENKRKIKGFIHDESASGQTSYIEPEEVFALNNKLRELEFERRREVIRILTDLTALVRPHIADLLRYHQLLCKIDVIRSKALFSIELNAHLPLISTEVKSVLFNARHPLLLLKKTKNIVPLNAKIDPNTRILLISGPNAGGKSVAMKTIGLLQVMFQAGILIPAASESQLGIFKYFFADIGDDQSIDNDLSTYSAHLTKMKYFLANSNSDTLILIDEFGAGTDPLFGGPMAEAILEQLHQKKVKGVITTHYSNLKQFANQTDGMENASMLFDNEAMQPLYVLDTGKPGSSYAFEIAKKIGLQAHVIHNAKNKVGSTNQKAETLLVDLEKEKKEFYTQKKNLEQQGEKLQSLMKENEKLKLFLTENKKAILTQAKKEAQEIIKNSNRLIEQTISEIKEHQAQKEKTLVLRQKLHQELHKNQIEIPEKPITESFLVGDWVQIKDSQSVGQIVGIDKKNLILTIGNIKTVVAISKAQKISHKEARKTSRVFSKIGTTQIEATFSNDIDIRGMRTADAMNEVERRFDKALVLGIGSLKILHGKGDGILRKMVAEYFKKYDQVSHLEHEHADRGGDGITYVYFKNS